MYGEKSAYVFDKIMDWKEMGSKNFLNSRKTDKYMPTQGHKISVV
jgi:hypothetical protein